LGASEPTEPSKEMEEQLVADLQKMFADVPKLELENPESLLSSKPDFEWHWTFLGFQYIRKDRQSRTKSRLTPSVEMILSSLRDLDIKEVYIGLGENALRMIINPNVYSSVHTPASENIF
jgi:hypothetical protein